MDPGYLQGKLLRGLKRETASLFGWGRSCLIPAKGQDLGMETSSPTWGGLGTPLAWAQRRQTLQPPLPGRAPWALSKAGKLPLPPACPPIPGARRGARAGSRAPLRRLLLGIINSRARLV